MIITLREIYKEVAEENKLPTTVVESIGELVFKHTRECLDDPNTLGVEIKRLGTFNLIQPRFIEFVRKYRSYKDTPFNKDNPGYQSRLNRFEALIKEIDRFKKEKILKRNKRYEGRSN